MDRWPTITDLANANVDEVRRIWSGMGYYGRAIRLLETAKLLTAEWTREKELKKEEEVKPKMKEEEHELKGSDGLTGVSDHEEYKARHFVSTTKSMNTIKSQRKFEPHDIEGQIFEEIGSHDDQLFLSNHQVDESTRESEDDMFPRDMKTWLKYPGVGEYTAGAVLSIAYGIKVPAVDGNVIR